MLQRPACSTSVGNPAPPESRYSQTVGKAVQPGCTVGRKIATIKPVEEALSTVGTVLVTAQNAQGHRRTFRIQKLMT